MMDPVEYDLAKYQLEEERLELEQEQAREAAELLADDILVDGVQLRDHSDGYELIMNISPYLLADLFREVDKAETDAHAMIRLQFAAKKLRDECRAAIARDLI